MNTVCGVTRIGVGDGKSMKELIGDAIRNAAMRFGVALDLWSKEELESVHPEDVHKATAPKPAGPPVNDEPEDFTPDPITAQQTKHLHALVTDLGLERDAKLAGIAKTIGHEIGSTKELTKDEATKVIKAMRAALESRTPSGGDDA